MALKKPMVLMPISGHAEQQLNALSMEKLGLARVASAGNLVKCVTEVLNQRDEYLLRFDRLNIDIDGAAQAAQLIKEAINDFELKN